MIQYKKGQIATEFILILSIILIVFLSFIMFYEQRDKEFLSRQDELVAKATAEKIATAINNIYVVGDGAYQTIYITDKGVIEEIMINHESREVIVTYDQRYYSYPLITSNIQSQELDKLETMIRNEEGSIVINQ